MGLLSWLLYALNDEHLAASVAGLERALPGADLFDLRIYETGWRKGWREGLRDAEHAPAGVGSREQRRAADRRAKRARRNNRMAKR